MSGNIRDPEMTALESALKTLAPRSAGIDRDRLMFLAGQQASRRHALLAPSIAAVLASAGTLTAVLLLYHPEQIVRHSSPTVEPSAVRSTDLAKADDRWLQYAKDLQLRNEVLRRGIDALPEPASGSEPGEPLNIESLFQ